MMRQIIIAIGLICSLNCALAAVPSNEKDALVTLYNSTNGPSWDINTNWLSGDPCADNWFGVTCDANSHITEIELIDNNLVATIPSEIGNLTYLQSLDFWGNELIGSIPSTIGNLSNLWFLDLGANQLSGSIPSSLGNLTNLNVLWLEDNQLSGYIPMTLGYLYDLEILGLYDNQFTGSIPSTLGSLTNLQILDLGSNQLSGSIPLSLGNLTNLEGLGLYENQLSGYIPSALGNLTNLQALWLFNNQLSGSIPSALGNLTNLQILWLDDNQLSGSIPSALGNLTNLQALFLFGNQLGGTIPSELGDLTNLIDLDLGLNELSGNIPAEIGNLANLQYLYLHRNKLSGPVPTTFTKLTQLVTTGEYYGLQLIYNALYTADAGLDAFLDSKSGYDWSSYQTVAPDMLSVSSTTIDSVTLAWNPIEYTADSGGYRVWYGTSSGGPYINGGITANKSNSSHTVTGLSSGQKYYFIVRTETNSHTHNPNKVISDKSNEVSVVATSSEPADLAITILDVANGTYAPEDQLVVNTKIENIGGTASDAYSITYYASTDTTITTGDHRLGLSNRAALGAGDYYHFNITIAGGLSSLADGSYYIGAILTVDDANSSNNTKYDPTPITVNADSPESNISSSYSGSWYNSAQDGHGLNVATLNETRTLVYWYVYHTDGTPMFLITVGTNDGNSTSGTTYYHTGMKFGSFNPDDNEQTVWGTSTVTFHDCNSATLEYSADDPAYGSGTIPMTRLTFVSGIKCSDSPLHGNYNGNWTDSGEVGYGLAVLFENGDLFTYSESDEFASVSVGEWWVTGSDSFQFDATGHSVNGGTTVISGSGSFSEDDLTATYTGGGKLFATPIQSFQHGLTTAKMAGSYDIYDWNDMVVGSVTIQDNGIITGADIEGCQLNGTFVVPNVHFNQAYLRDASISGCGDTVYGEGAAVYRNATDEIVIAAVDGWTGYIWTLKRK